MAEPQFYPINSGTAPVTVQDFYDFVWKQSARLNQEQSYLEPVEYRTMLSNVTDKAKKANYFLSPGLADRVRTTLTTLPGKNSGSPSELRSCHQNMRLLMTDILVETRPERDNAKQSGIALTPLGSPPATAILSSARASAPQVNKPNSRFEENQAQSNALRLQGLLTVEQERVESLERDLREAQGESQRATRDLSQARNELARTKTLLEDTLKGAEFNRKRAGHFEEKFINAESEVAEVKELIGELNQEAERIQAELEKVRSAAKVPALSEAVRHLHDNHAKIISLNQQGRQEVPAPLVQYSADLLKLCDEHLGDTHGDLQKIPLGMLDALVYGAPPPIARQFLGENDPVAGDRWDLIAGLMVALTVAQGWAHQQLKHRGLEPIFVARGEAFNPAEHERDERNTATTDDPEKRGKVDVTLRHGYRLRGRPAPLRPAVVRCFR